MENLIVERKTFDRNVAFLLKSHVTSWKRLFSTTLLTLSHDDNSDPEYTIYLHRGHVRFYERLWLPGPAIVEPETLWPCPVCGRLHYPWQDNPAALCMDCYCERMVE